MMKKGIGSDVSGSTRKIVKQAAKQMAGEPFEMLRTAGKQISGVETATAPIRQEPQEGLGPKKENTSLSEETINAKSNSLLEALEKEMGDIRKQKEFEEEQKLKEEEVQEQIIEEEEKDKPAPMISAKRAKGAIQGMKGQLQKLKSKAEIRMPPSG